MSYQFSVRDFQIGVGPVPGSIIFADDGEIHLCGDCDESSFYALQLSGSNILSSKFPRSRQGHYPSLNIVVPDDVLIEFNGIHDLDGKGYADNGRVALVSGKLGIYVSSAQEFISLETGSGLSSSGFSGLELTGWKVSWMLKGKVIASLTEDQLRSN